MNKDFEHLKTLSLCYYIWAGVIALFACIPFIHLYIGVMMVTGGFQANAQDPPPPLFGWFFIGLASVFIVGGWATAICTFLTGKYLRKQKNYVFCLVLAAINCTILPFGAILGVFTFVVLMRDSVKALFGRIAPQNFATASNPPDWK